MMTQISATQMMSTPSVYQHLAPTPRLRRGGTGASVTGGLADPKTTGRLLALAERADQLVEVLDN